MKPVWQGSFFEASAALMACVSAQGAWASGESSKLVAESSVSSSAWDGMGVWVALGAFSLLGVLLVGWLLRTRAGERSTADLAVQGSSIDGVQAFTPRGYSEKNVGNDASARPWERSGPTLDAGTAAGSQGGVVLGAAVAAIAVPSDFDTAAFIKASKFNFVALQDAWDRSDIPSLRAMMTDGMFEQIKNQLAEREQASIGMAKSATEVVMLDAHLLGIEEQEEAYMASVEFSGMLREDPAAGPSPFRELWSITRPKAGEGGWLVAGVQALQ